jgi:L-alanine-DL-glutamate epimerase-like enolase superfamily enzyme
MKITGYEIHQDHVKLNEPFITALRQVSEYPIIRLKLETDLGGTGYGEVVATPAISGDTNQGIIEDLEGALRSGILGLEVSELSQVVQKLEIAASARAALDMALWECQHAIESNSVKSDVTIPICDLSALEPLVRARLAAGFTTFKIKIEEVPLDQLKDRLTLIYQLADNQIPLRIDPNQSWSFEYARKALKVLEKLEIPIEYLEQPLAKEDIKGHRALKEESSIALMADESCFSIADLESVISSQAFTFLNIKLLKAGGITPSLHMGKIALENGLMVSVGSMMESERGVRAAAFVAAKLAPDVTHDLDAAWWISDSYLTYRDGYLHT